MRKLFIINLFLFIQTSTFIEGETFAKDEFTPLEIATARQVIARQIGSRAQEITLQMLPNFQLNDTFQIHCQEGHLKIQGSSAVALCYAFRVYLQQACQGMITWSGNYLPLPTQWPDYRAANRSPFLYRYFLNVCTFGYTAPYWDWKRWQKEIDWMALHGINMPLATIASEAIAERVWLQLGLSKEEIRQFFTAPAHLPWHRMGNLNSWDGPLTDDWQKEQIQIQHQVLNRMRALGMHPIAPAFAGFVPEAFVKKHPEIVCKHLKWGGFPEGYNAYVLPPDSPFFQEIGKRFIQEWEKEFGKMQFYLSDSFNEMKLPLNPNDTVGKHQLLAQYGESIYQSIHTANPDAVWVTQGWTLGYQADFWDKASLQALLSRVPNDKMLIIDLGNDYPKWVWHTQQTWKIRDGFFGKPWIFSYVPNFGGKNQLTGDLPMYASSSVEALESPHKGNLVGFGSAPEGLENNEVIYELLADMGWSRQPINLDVWLNTYCKARYGDYPKQMQQAWDLLRKSAYSSLYSYPRFTWQTVIPDTRRISRLNVGSDFCAAVRHFLNCADALKDSPLYCNDAILLTSFYAAAKADSIYQVALKADSLGDTSTAHLHLNRATEILLRVDRLLASHPSCSLQNWIALAHHRATSKAEALRYEANAKRLITTWGGGQADYAARFWNGLIRDYYIPRMKMQINHQQNERSQWEENWIQSPYSKPASPYKYPLAEARQLLKELNQ